MGGQGGPEQRPRDDSAHDSGHARRDLLFSTEPECPLEVGNACLGAKVGRPSGGGKPVAF